MIYYFQAVDAVYFCQSNAEGFYLVTATARRQNGMIQILTYLRVSLFSLFYYVFIILLFPGAVLSLQLFKLN